MNQKSAKPPRVTTCVHGNIKNIITEWPDAIIACAVFETKPLYVGEWTAHVAVNGCIPNAQLGERVSDTSLPWAKGIITGINRTEDKRSGRVSHHYEISKLVSPYSDWKLA